MQLDNATGRPQLQTQVRLFRENQQVFSSQVLNVAGQPTAKRVVAIGHLKQAAETRNFFFAEAEKVLLGAYEVSGNKLAVVHLQLARLYEKKGDRNRAAGELEQYLKSPEAKDSAAIRDAIRKLRAPDK